jgi:TIR domain-containing protein
MDGIPVGKRRFHAFLSHAHVDKTQADRLAEWLQDVAGVRVWYDAVNMPPGGTIARVLPDAIEHSRAMIILLSNESVSRGWVQQEYNAAIDHQTRHPAFRVIPVRLDDVGPPGFLRNYCNISLDRDGLDPQSAAGIMKGLYQPTAVVDPTGGRNVYVGRGWHLDDAKVAEALCAALTAAGLQLIGDAEDQPSWVEARVAGIIEACGAFAAALPYRPFSALRTSKYILREWELAVAHGLPCLVVADARVELPPEIAGRAGFIPLTGGKTGDAGSLEEAAAALAENWKMPARSPSIFYAADFEAARKPLRQAVKELVEAVTTLPCVIGEYVKGDEVQREILRRVSGATLMLADISADSPNVYIEIGAARASNVPTFLLRQGPPGRPAFMLRDQQVWDYSTDADLLGRVIRIVYPYRRTLLASADA